jgi:hypothetical protein
MEFLHGNTRAREIHCFACFIDDLEHRARETVRFLPTVYLMLVPGTLCSRAHPHIFQKEINIYE